VVLPPEEDSTGAPPEEAAGWVLPPEEEEVPGEVEPPLEVPMDSVPPVPDGPSDEDGLQATRQSTPTPSMGNDTSRD
jgi:hypothetical protein